MRWVLAAIVSLAVACGGGRKGSSDPRDGDVNTTLPGSITDAASEPLDFEEVELGTSQAYLPLLKVGAAELGCMLVAEEPDPPAVAYQCEQGTVFAAQVGTVLRYACQHITKQQCNALFERINKKVLEAAGGQ